MDDHPVEDLHPAGEAGGELAVVRDDRDRRPVHAVQLLDEREDLAPHADEVGAAAVDYLRVIGHLVMSYFWARMAKLALARVAADGDAVDPFYVSKLATARFYFAKLQPETASLIRSARAGSATLMALDADLF